MSDAAAPIAVALDAPTLERATDLAREVSPWVSTMKVGLELYLRTGPDGVLAVRDAAPNCQLFLDLKLHDIPNTVAGAVRSITSLSPTYLTVHASGGPKMIAAAVAEAVNTTIAAVTVLTSLDAADLETLGMAGPPADAVRRLAVLAVDAGAGALVCSPQEVALVRAEVGPAIVLITPGVRPPAADLADQSRVATPEQALRDGADLLVIGRPITAADSPGTAAKQIAAAIAR